MNHHTDMCDDAGTNANIILYSNDCNVIS